MRVKIVFFLFLIFSFSPLLADSGRDIFDRFCTACHSPAMASLFNSPPAHDANAWEERKNNAFKKSENYGSIKEISEIEKNEISINELVKSAISGTEKGMPPKGTCSECTDDDLKSVIKFMISSGK